MDKFKQIEITPLRKLSDLNLKVANQKRYDLGIRSSEQMKEILSLAMSEARKVPGALIFSGNGNDMFLNATLKTAKNKKMYYTFPEVNPISIYYRSAIIHAEAAVAIRKKLRPEHDPMSRSSFLEFADFFTEASQSVILLSATVEGFINQLIPEDIEIDLGSGMKTKAKLEFLDLNRKMRELLPAIGYIDFYKESEAAFNSISLLIVLRNDLIHLKTNVESNGTSYQEIYKRLMDFNYPGTGDAVFNFVNSVKPDYFRELETSVEEQSKNPDAILPPPTDTPPSL